MDRARGDSNPPKNYVVSDLSEPTNIIERLTRLITLYCHQLLLEFKRAMRGTLKQISRYIIAIALTATFIISALAISGTAMAGKPPLTKPDLWVPWMQITDTYGNAASSDNGLTIGSGQDFFVEARIWNGLIAAAGPFSIDLYIDESDGTPKFCGRVNCPGLAIGGIFEASWTDVFTSISGSTPAAAPLRPWRWKLCCTQKGAYSSIP